MMLFSSDRNQLDLHTSQSITVSIIAGQPWGHHSIYPHQPGPSGPVSTPHMDKFKAFSQVQDCNITPLPQRQRAITHTHTPLPPPPHHTHAHTHDLPHLEQRVVARPRVQQLNPQQRHAARHERLRGVRRLTSATQ